jgi:hypothetical protein
LNPRLLLLACAALLLALAWSPTGGTVSAQVPSRMREVPEPVSPPASVAPEVTPTVRFTDAAGRSQISYVSNNDYREKGRKYFPQPMCGGVGLLDFDGDGKLDVFFTNGGKLPDYTRPDPSYYSCLLRGRGDGTFEEVTLKAKVEGKNLDISYGVAVGDYDNDGRPDLFIANAGPNALYHNNGDGTFSEATLGSGLDKKAKDLLSVCAAFFDYDNDGLLDLVVSHYTYWNPRIDRVCPTPEGEIYCYPGTYASVAHSLYRNLGKGKFEDVSRKAGFDTVKGKGMGIGIADFNGDGWMDVFVANDTEPNFLYVNKGDGTFSEESWAWGIAYDEQGAVVSGMGADARDFNDDGFPDVFYNNLQSQIWALFQNEKGTHFRYVSPRTGVARLSRRFSGWSNAIFDYDNDGWKDIYSANGDVDYLGTNSAQHDTMFHNVDGKVFADVSAGLGPDFTPKGYQRGSAYGDLDGDGFPDLVVTSLNKKPRILLNSGGNGKHWLWLDLVGTKSNRDAIGTKVKLTTPSGRVLHNHVSVSVGFMSSSDKKLHFGLGGDSSARSIEIRWPSGKTKVLENVKADQVLRIEEES